MRAQKSANAVGGAVRTPIKGSKPRTSAEVQKTCRQCKAPTRLVKGFVVCQQDPNHNFKPVKIVCGMCGAGRSDLVIYPGKVWCTKCAATTIDKQAKVEKKVVNNKVVQPKAGKPKVKSVKSVPGNSPQKKKIPFQPIGVNSRGLKSGDLKWFGKTKQTKTTKPKFAWIKKTVGNVKGLESHIFYTNKTMQGAQLAALRESPCFSCGGKFATGGGWSSIEPPSSSGKISKGSIITMACPRNTCLSEYNVVVVVEKKKKEFKTLPLTGKGKKILTPQPPLAPETRPVDLSEDQVKTVFDEESSRHNLREKIVSAFVAANEDFRLADSGARQTLVNNARRQIKLLERQMPQRLNLRQKTGPVRTVPLRWKINRRTILNPLWSVTLSLLSESDQLNPEDVELIQETAYHSVILESLLPKKKKKNNSKKTAEAVHQVAEAAPPPTPHPSEEVTAEELWGDDASPDSSWLQETQEERYENQ
ncbi:hypothetical protein 1 [Wenzhou tombus-like virus 12]|uniref:hypothetical protein 1 n=1 Tax=Wenzhou tombus-like virus 12 TaxID=1923665 RepID=UPI00090CC702|nr:hypothetical protein 1 [Wenzhou tombus-like virus 12]APG76604.1 hypothetical protein 1 [Wenzhou tombus-like virus 12]